MTRTDSTKFQFWGFPLPQPYDLEQITSLLGLSVENVVEGMGTYGNF